MAAELIFAHAETCDCERICRADHVQAFVIAESVSDVSKRRNCFAHLSAVHHGVHTSGERSFLKLGKVKGDLRSSMGQERLSMLTLMSIEHELLRSLDFTDTVEEFALAKARKTAIGDRPIS